MEQILKTILCLSALFSCFVNNLLADDIYFKNGRIYKNVKVIKEDDSWIYCQTTDGDRRFKTEDVLKVELINFDPNTPSGIVNERDNNSIIFGFNMPYLNIGGDFKSELVLVSTGKYLVALPQIPDGIAFEFILGISNEIRKSLEDRGRIMSFDIRYLMSSKDLGNSQKKKHTLLSLFSLNTTYSSKPFDFAGFASRVYLHLGGSYSFFKLEDSAVFYNQLAGNTVISDVTFRGWGYLIGSGLGLHLSNQIVFNTFLKYNFVKYSSIKFEDGTWRNIGNEEAYVNGVSYHLGLGLIFAF